MPTVSQQCEPFHRCSYRRDADLLPTEYQGDPIGWPPEERGHWSGHKRTKLGESFQVSMALWSAVSVSREFESSFPSSLEEDSEIWILRVVRRAKPLHCDVTLGRRRLPVS